MKIVIKKSSTADTRTCDWSKVSKEELLEVSKQHINDVRQGIDCLIDMLVCIRDDHDRTKISEIDLFWEDFKTGFRSDKWWEMHKRVERHHLSDSRYIQDDINLLDVIEQIVDGVMAGMARSGEFEMESLSDELLQKAYRNTVKLLLDRVEVKQDRDD